MTVGQVPSRQKAVVVAEGGKVALREVDVPRPSSGQILVKVVAAAQNPSDWKTVLFAKKVGAIVGADFAGIVVQTGPELPDGLRIIGERVAGFVHGAMICNGAFAEYVVADAYVVTRIPLSWSFEDAAQLGIAAFTAAQCLYATHNFLTPLEPGETPETLLVFGGATSVGQYVIQLAKLAGLHVLVTCSPKDFELVKALGADEAFDYTSPRVSMTIRVATRGRLKYAVDCISERQTPQQVANALGNEGGLVATLCKYESPRPGVDVNLNLPFMLLPEDFDYPMFYTAMETEIEQGRRLAKLLTGIIAKENIRPNPLCIMPEGLASVEQGFKFMMEGKFNAEKITFRISDTPSLKSE